VREVLRNVPAARRLLAERRVERVVSTGAGIALAFLPIAAARRIPSHYIELAARSEGPSLTGRLVAALPGVRVYAQHPAWAAPPWTYQGSVFDAFAPVDAPLGRPLRSVVVTLGTIPYDFRALVDRLLAILPADVEVLWQTGATDVSDLPITAEALMPADELDRRVAEADVVVAHAGTGSALSALEVGRCPVLVPRRAAHDEHVDDHQPLIADLLSERGLAITAPVDELTLEHLERAAAVAVVERGQPPVYRLAEGRRRPRPSAQASA
jgi:UDP-N-acetylglucosamine transferase subunit ALG13